MSSLLPRRSDPVTRVALIKMIEDLNRVMDIDGMDDLLDDYTFDHVDIISQFNSVQVFRDVITEHAPMIVDDMANAERIVTNFAYSQNVLLCHSTMMRDGQAIDSPMFSHLLKIIYEKSGWSMVSCGYEDCIDLGDEGMFCLVKDLTHTTVVEYAQLQESVGYAGDMLFNQQMVDYRCNLFNNIGQSWRDWAVSLFPLTPTEMENVSNGADVKWTAERPLWEEVVVEGQRIIQNNSASETLLTLLDDTTEFKNRLVQRVIKDAERIATLEKEISRLKQTT